MWYVILVLIIDALVCGFSAFPSEEQAPALISPAAKMLCGILCLLNVIATVILFMS